MARSILTSAGRRTAAALLLAGALVSAAAAQTLQAQSEMEVPPGMDPWQGDPAQLDNWDLQKPPPRLIARSKRHREYLAAGIPVEYRNHANPYPVTEGSIRVGGRLYAENCAKCHGTEGLGDGDAGLALSPSPALLAALMEAQGAVDEYLLWTVSEGGARFDTDMPAFKDKLTEDQIWQIVAYMRAGFPAVE